MKTRARAMGAREDRRAPATRPSSPQTAEVVIADARAEGAAQRRLARAVEQAPRSRRQRELATRVQDSAAMLVQRKRIEGAFGLPVQRQAPEEEEELQMKTDPSVLQRQGLEEEELLQGKFDPLQRQDAEEAVLLQGKGAPRSGAIVQAQAPSPTNRTGLPDNLKAGIEALSGMDMSDVRVHGNSPEPARLDALAYAQGNDIHLAAGQDAHLPHEAWHLVQQRQGRAKPTMQAKGVQINDDPGLEKEADVMGERALQMRCPDQNAAHPATRAASANQRAGVATEAAHGCGAATAASGGKGRLNFLSTAVARLHAPQSAIQRISLGAGRGYLTRTAPWKDVIPLHEFQEYLVAHDFGTKDNPYAELTISQLRQQCDLWVQRARAEELRSSIGNVQAPGLEYQVKGLVATIVSQVLTDFAHKDFDEEQRSWKERQPQWVDVQGGPTGEGTLLYRFCDFLQIQRMLPRVAWESFADTVESVKAKKRTLRNPEPDYTLTWNALRYIEMKGQGEECLRLVQSSGAPAEEVKVLQRAFEHMGRAQTRLSPFVSLSEDLALLVNSTCPTMQSIIRSEGHLEDVEATEEMPGHRFHRIGEGVVRAKGYERAPHVVRFEVPPELIVTPEMVDEFRGLTKKEIDEGLGLKAMRDVKERLFLGTDIWRYAVSVAVNPY